MTRRAPSRASPKSEASAPDRYAATTSRLANRLRATSAAAAAPNNSTIGGAGTGAGGPPVDPVLPDPLLDALEALDALDALDALEALLPDALLPFELHPPVEL
jgi:hypothetical protein